MSLPTPDQIASMYKTLGKFVPEEKSKAKDFKAVHEHLKKQFEIAVEGLHEAAEEVGNFMLDQAAEKAFEATTMAAKGPALHAGGMAIVGVSMIALAPLSAALSPWIKAYKISSMAEGIFKLHDLAEHARKYRHFSSKTYHCTCGHCADNIKYILDKSEWRVIHMALSVATVGLWYGIKKAHSGVKALQNMNKASKKDRVSYDLVTSARGGCSAAVAAIFLRVAEETKNKAKVAAHAIAILIADDGWLEFEELW